MNKGRKTILPITYTPDFVGMNWIMETKGHRHPDFDLRWKLFKRLLAELDAPYTLIMPRNNSQLEEAIDIIKELNGQNKELLQDEKDFQLVFKFNDESPMS